MVNHFIPKSYKEALEYRASHNCYILAGGTDLMVQKFVSSSLLPNFEKDVLYIAQLEELNYVRKDEEGSVHIGATTKYVDIVSHKDTPKLMKDIILEIAGPNIRNMATMVGNIGNASPAGDSLVGLYLLDAKLELASRSGSRIIKLQDFILGVRKIDLHNDEIIKEIIIPSHNLVTYWQKVGSRKAESISKATFAGAYRIENGILKDFRLAFGSVFITVVRKQELEAKYINKKVSDIDVDEVVNEYSKVISPITDQRSTKDYRFKVEMNILRKFLNSMKGVENEK